MEKKWEKQRKKTVIKQKKAAKIAATIGSGLAVSYAGYKFSTNPKVRKFVYNILVKKGNLKVSDVKSDLKIFSKALGRYLTLEEMIEKGFI